MDISNWPVGRIMQLPDWCFGNRWVVACDSGDYNVSDSFGIVRTGVPDRCVIWEIFVSQVGATSGLVRFELGWADQLVTTSAQWTALQKMFPCQGQQDRVDFRFGCLGDAPWHINGLRLVSPAAGLRPAIRNDGSGSTGITAQACFVISSLPKEVPDWLISGQGRFRQ